MNFRNIKKITFALTLALGFAGALGLSSMPTVQAQQPQPRPQEKGREQLRPVTMEERSAFREGYRRGWEDSRARRHFDYNRSRLYRMGDREYRDTFRRGYTRGYRRQSYQ
jgi:hypothetical protein